MKNNNDFWQKKSEPTTPALTANNYFNFWLAEVAKFKSAYPELNDLVNSRLGLWKRWEWELLQTHKAITADGTAIVADGWFVKDFKDNLIYEGNNYDLAKRAGEDNKGARVERGSFTFTLYSKFKNDIVEVERNRQI
jgi:hypothetical protein